MLYNRSYLTWYFIRCIFKNNLFGFDIIGHPTLFVNTSLQESGSSKMA
uniref:Uncharacterized protein n=1 Tax=Arundo donax TaxID=35708 RepID=A0A0A9G6D2_ARUDO